VGTVGSVGVGIGWVAGVDGTYSLFIRVVVVVPQTRHSLTRYGSRENSALSGVVLSVRIRTFTSWGVSRPQSEHASAIVVAASFVVAILSAPCSGTGIKRADR